MTTLAVVFFAQMIFGVVLGISGIRQFNRFKEACGFSLGFTGMFSLIAVTGVPAEKMMALAMQYIVGYFIVLSIFFGFGWGLAKPMTH
ncbi:MAG: hypothetical protein WCT08_03560 [Patescibacteria group bacterium]